VAIVWKPLNKNSQKSFLNKIKAPEAHALQEPFLLFYLFTFLPFHAMHELTPSAVAMADRILIAV